MDNLVKVEIAGCTYHLRTDEDPEYIQMLANFVTAKVFEIKRDTGASALDCTALAALDIADLYHKELTKKKPGRKKAAEPQSAEEPKSMF